MNVLTFYQKQSLITDPLNYAYLFADVPPEISAIRKVCQGLLLLYLDDFVYQLLTPEHHHDIDIQFVSAMLKRILHYQPSDLNQSRVIGKRFIGTCRDFSTLACSILRFYRIPARLRFGFSAYYQPDPNYDFVALEYWNENKKKWSIVDLEVSNENIKKYNFSFSIFDIPHTQFLTAGQVWQKIRNEEIDINTFYGQSRQHILKGLWYIRDLLILDFAALNAVEMLPFHVWGMMLNNDHFENDESQLLFIDQLAELTLNPDLHFHKIRHIFSNDPRVSIPDKILTISPVMGKHYIYWKRQ